MAVLLIDCVPDCLDVETDDDGFVITVPALEQVEGFKFVSLDSRLSPIYDHRGDTYEFSFGFTVSDIDGLEPSSLTLDRYEVERYFDGNTREYVLPTVCACLEELVDHVQPAYIYRVTKGRNLPQSAMQKHSLVTDTLLGLGYYEIQIGTDDFNRQFWFMGR